ncbi:MAG: NADH-quinone oxidoreductase subunit N, partial [Anaerolineae bacterium]|nr:NADH-quinone oxidoreductase subunit N [Anaerolineae bacterium]
KVAAVPFHMWTPDVYEGSPTPITAYMSVAAKVGGFAALFRLMIVGLSGFSLNEGVDPAAWQSAIQVIAALTLILGNFVALSQTNIKRMLAYSSIAHAGYILMAVAAVGSAGLTPNIVNTAAQAGLVYLLAYAFTNLGAFAVVLALENKDGTGTELSDFNGLYNSRPMLALAMAVFMFSLTGIPLTAGFMGKWLVFSAAVQAGLIPLAIIGVLTSVISAFYYVRVIVNMFLLTDDAGSPATGETAGVRYAVYASMAGVLIVGIAVPFVTNLVSMVSLV